MLTDRTSSEGRDSRTPDAISDLSSAIVPGMSRRQLRLLIETAVTRVFGVAHDDLERPTRGRKKVALARQAAMYLAHVVCGLSLKDAGLLFDRDRTTAAHACVVIEDRRDDPLFDRVMQLLEWIIPALLSPHSSLLPQET